MGEVGNPAPIEQLKREPLGKRHIQHRIERTVALMELVTVKAKLPLTLRAFTALTPSQTHVDIRVGDAVDRQMRVDVAIIVRISRQGRLILPPDVKVIDRQRCGDVIVIRKVRLRLRRFIFVRVDRSYQGTLEDSRHFL